MKRTVLLFIMLILVLALATPLAAYAFCGPDTPLRVKLSYAKNALSYDYGDVETIRFTIYLNKSDSLLYSPGYQYLLLFDGLTPNTIQDTTLTVMATSLIPQMVFLDDRDSTFTGYIKYRCDGPRSSIRYSLPSYRIIPTTEEKGNDMYPFVRSTDLKYDQTKTITFKNPNWSELDQNDLRTLDIGMKR